MKNKLMLVLALCIGLSGSFAVKADSFAPSNHCMKPVKPYSFTSEWQVNSYKSDVNRYESCLKDFVAQQERAARNHQKAAQEAVDEWNNFVRYELR